MPQVSIIIAVYNGQKDLQHCVNSILHQTFKDLEVIVVNDGSTDNTAKICNELEKSDNRVKIISKQNDGRMKARLTGYLAAQGEFLAFFDHDDYLPKNAIQCLYDIIKKYQVDCAVGSHEAVLGSFPLFKKYVTFPTTGHVISGESRWEECFGFLENYGGGDRLPTFMWGKLFRKSCIDKAWSEEPELLFQKVLMEDCWFNLVSLKYINSIYVTNDVVYYYRVGGSTSGDYPMLENSNHYFNYRYRFFEKAERGRDQLLSQTYICFINTLYWEVRLKLRSKKYTQKQISNFICSQINEQDVVKWARNHPECIPSQVNKMSTPVLNHDDEYIINTSQEEINRLRKRDTFKKVLIKCMDYTYSSIKH